VKAIIARTIRAVGRIGTIYGWALNFEHNHRTSDPGHLIGISPRQWLYRSAGAGPVRAELRSRGIDISTLDTMTDDQVWDLIADASPHSGEWKL